MFENIFGRQKPAPRAANTPATDKITPGEIRESLERKGFSRVDARRIYAHLFDPDTGLIPVAVDAGADVQLTGLGKFERRERTEGYRHNPRTGEKDFVPASHYPAFKVSPRWRKAINATPNE